MLRVYPLFLRPAACSAGICRGIRASCLTFAATGSPIRDCEIETGRGPTGCARRPTYLGCVHTSAAGVRSCGCSIDGACYAHGTRKPGNACVACDVSVSVNAWTPVPPEPCDDGQACTYGDSCQFGVCRGTPYACSAAGACLRNATCDGRGGCALNLLPAGTQCAPAIDACTPASQCDGATAACPPRAVRVPSVSVGVASLLEIDGTLPDPADASGFAVLGASGGTAALVRLSSWSVPCGDLSFSVALAPVDASGALPRCSEAAISAAPAIGGDATPWGPELDVPFRALAIPNGTLVEAIVRARNIAGYVVAGCSGAALVDARPPSPSAVVNVRPGSVSPPPLLLDPPTIVDAQLTGSAEAWTVHSGSSLAFAWEPFTAPDALLTWSGALEYEYAVGRASTAATNGTAALDDVIPWTPVRPRSQSARREAVDTGAAPLPQGLPLVVSVRGRTRSGVSAVASSLPVTLDAAGAAGLITVYDGVSPSASSVSSGSSNSSGSADSSSGLSAAEAFASGTLAASWTLDAQPTSGLDHWEVCFSTQASSCDVTPWEVLPPAARQYTASWPATSPPVSGVAYRAVVRGVARSGAIAQARSVGLTYDATPPQGLVWTLPPFLPSPSTATATFFVNEPESPIAAARVWIADVRASDPSNPGRRVFVPLTRVADASISSAGTVTVAFNTTPPGGLKVYWCGWVENAAGLRSETACAGAVADGTPPDAFTVTSVKPNANVALNEDPTAPSAVHDGPSLRAIWSSSQDDISGIVAYELQAQVWTAATAASPAAWTAASAIFSTGSEERAFDFVDVWRPAAPGTYRVRMLAVNGGGARTAALSQPTIIDFTPPVLPAVADGPFPGADLSFVSDAASWSASWLGSRDDESGVTSTLLGVAPCGSAPGASSWVPIFPPNATSATVALSALDVSLTAGSPRFCTFVRLTNGAGLTTDAISDGAVFDPTPPTSGSASAGGALSSVADTTAYVQPTSRVAVTWTGLTDAESGVDVFITVGSKPGLADLMPATAIPAAAVAASSTSFSAAVCAGPGFCWVTLEARNGARVSTSTTSNRVVLLLPPRAGAVAFVLPPSPMAMDSWALAAGANASLPVVTAVSASSDASRVALLLSGFGGGGVPVARFLLDLGSAPGRADIARAFDNGPSPLALISGLALRQGSRVYARVTAVSAAGLSVVVNGTSPLLIDTGAGACGMLALHGVAGAVPSGGTAGTLAWWAEPASVTVSAQNFAAPVSGLADVFVALHRSPWPACAAGQSASGSNACGSGETVLWRRQSPLGFDLGNASNILRLDSPDGQPLERGFRYRIAATISAQSGGSCTAFTPSFALDNAQPAQPVVLPASLLPQMSSGATAAVTATALAASGGMLRNLRWQLVRSDADAPFVGWSVALQQLNSSDAPASSSSSARSSDAAPVRWIPVDGSTIQLASTPAADNSTSAAAAAIAASGSTLHSPAVAPVWFSEDRLATAGIPLSVLPSSGAGSSAPLAPGAYRLRLRGVTAANVAVEAAPVSVVIDYTPPVAAAPVVATAGAAGLTGAGGMSGSGPSGSAAVAGSTKSLQLMWEEASDPESGIAGYVVALLQGASGTGPTVSWVALPPGSRTYTFNLTDSPLQQGGAYTVRLSAVNGANMTSTATLALTVDTRTVAAGSVAVVRARLCPADSSSSSVSLQPFAVAAAVSPACGSGSKRQLLLPVSICGFTLAGSGSIAPGDVTLVAWAGSTPNATDLMSPMILPPLSATNPTCSVDAVGFTQPVLDAVAPGAAAAACGASSPLRGFTMLSLPCGSDGSAVFVSVRGINAAGASPVATSSAVQLVAPSASAADASAAVWQLAVGGASGVTFAAGSSSGAALSASAARFAPAVFLQASTRSIQLAWTAPRPAGSSGTEPAACTSAVPASDAITSLCPGGLSHYEYAFGSSPGAADMMPRMMWTAIQATSVAATQAGPISVSISVPNGLLPGRRYFAAVRAVSRGGDTILVTHSAPFSLGAPIPTGGNITCATSLDPYASLTVKFAGFTYVPFAPTTLVFTACVAHHWDTPCEPRATATSELAVDRSADERPLQLPSVDVVITDLWDYRNILQDDVYVRGVVTVKGAGASTGTLRPPHNLTVDITPPGGIKQSSLRLVRLMDDPASGESSVLPASLEWPFIGAAPLSAYRLSMWNLSDAESGIAAVSLAVGFAAGGQQLQPFTPITPIPSPPELAFGGLLPLPGAILGGGSAVVVTLRVTNNALQTRQVSTPPIAVDATPPLPFTVATGAAPADAALLGYSGAVDSALRFPLDMALCHWSSSADAESGLGYYLVALGGTPPATATDAERAAWLPWTRVAPSAQSAQLRLNANPPHGSRVYCSVKACNRANDCTLAFDRIGSNVDRTPPLVASDAGAAVIWDGAVCGQSSWNSVSTEPGVLAACWFGAFEEPDGAIVGHRVSVIALPSGVAVVANRTVGADAGVRLTDLPLSEGQTYAFEVAAVNAAGAVSRALRSRGAMVDTQAPVLDAGAAAGAAAFAAAAAVRASRGSSRYSYTAAARAELPGRNAPPPLLSIGAAPARGAGYNMSMALALASADGASCIPRRPGEVQLPASGNGGAVASTCAPGWQRSAALGVCVPCPRGFVKAAAGEDGCRACPWESAHAAVSKSLDGPAFAPLDARSDAAAACSCPSALHWFSASAHACVCRPGFVAMNDTGAAPAACTPCPAGTFKAVPGNSAVLCALCPAGSSSIAGSLACSCPVSGFVFDAATRACVCPAGFALSPYGACERCPAGTYKPRPGAESVCLPCPWGTASSQDGSTCTVDQAILSGGVFIAEAPGGGAAACPAGTVLDVAVSGNSNSGMAVRRTCRSCGPLAMQPSPLIFRSEAGASASAGTCKPCGALGAAPVSLAASATDAVYADWSALFVDSSSGIDFVEFTLGTVPGGAQVAGPLRFPRNVTSAAWPGLLSAAGLVGVPVFAAVRAVDRGGLSTMFVDPAPVMWDPTGPWMYPLLDGVRNSSSSLPAGYSSSAVNVSAVSVRAPLVTDVDGVTLHLRATADVLAGLNLSSAAVDALPDVSMDDIIDTEYTAETDRILAASLPPADTESGIADVVSCLGSSPYQCDVLEATPVTWDATSYEAAADESGTDAVTVQRPSVEALLVSLRSQWAMSSSTAATGRASQPLYVSLWAVAANGMLAASVSDGVTIAPAGPRGGTVLDGPGDAALLQASVLGRSSSSAATVADASDADCLAVGVPLTARWHGFASDAGGIERFLWGAGSAPGAFDWLPLRDVGVATSASAPWVQPGPGSVVFSTIVAIDRAGMSRAIASDGVSYVCGGSWRNAGNATARSLCAAQAASPNSAVRLQPGTVCSSELPGNVDATAGVFASLSASF